MRGGGFGTYLPFPIAAEQHRLGPAKSIAPGSVLSQRQSLPGEPVTMKYSTGAPHGTVFTRLSSSTSQISFFLVCWSTNSPECSPGQSKKVPNPTAPQCSLPVHTKLAPDEFVFPSFVVFMKTRIFALPPSPPYLWLPCSLLVCSVTPLCRAGDLFCCGTGGDPSSTQLWVVEGGSHNSLITAIK